VIAYHYPPELLDTPPLNRSAADAEKILAIGRPQTLSVEIRDLPRNASLLVETLDVAHGFALPAWKAMGAPEPPSREQTEILRESAWNLRREFLQADDSGTFRMERTLEPWTVLMIREIR
jgi:xylan 1,4-beta-xylosidase